MSRILVPPGGGSTPEPSNDEPAELSCDHGVTFDEESARGMDAYEVRKRWPRGFGPCPRGCGFTGIAYASYMHYLSGDW